MQVQYTNVIEDLIASHEILTYFYSRESVLKDKQNQVIIFTPKGK